MPGEELKMITVYYRPRDLPDHVYVAREFTIAPGGPVPAPEVFATGNTLAEVRAQIPAYLIRMPRDPNDDPTVVESWI